MMHQLGDPVDTGFQEGRQVVCVNDLPAWIARRRALTDEIPIAM